MASVSGATSSLGNTALRGFGGLASGIDRDTLIEQLTSGTSSKITKQKMAMTKLTWKQEAFRSISGKILDLQDNFLGFSSSNSLKDPSFFAKNQITVMGDSNITKYVKASGTSDMIDYLSLMGVKQLATSANRLSDSKTGPGSITTDISKDKFESSNENVLTSKLEGTKLTFGTYNATDSRFTDAVSFTFPSSYTVEENGKKVTKEIDYTAAPDKVVEQLNEALKSQQFMSEKAGTSGIEFKYDAKTKQISIEQTANITDAGKNYVIKGSSSALEALGFNKTKLTDDELKDGVSLDEFKKSADSFDDAYVKREKLKDYLVGKSITVTFGGQTKTIELIKDSEKDSINTLEDLKKTVQSRLDKAFGSGKVTADTTDGKLSFKPVNANDTLTVNADSKEVRKVLGIEANQSNKMSLDASLYYNREQLGFDKNLTEEQFAKELENFTINGVKLEGITKDTTVNQLINMINDNEEMGVRASYMENTNQFVLTAKDTGSGRKIELGGAADKIFGTNGGNGRSEDGKDAEILVSYGNGIERTITSSSNTFELEGLTVTVSNTFGIDEKGNYTKDASQAVTFSASANTEAVTEQVKKFIEAYNELIKDVNTQLTTKPNSSYGPLTDDQKAEMDKESIENWENKAKEGILFNNSAIRELGISLQGVLSSLMGDGVSSQDLEKIGITMSDDQYDGGTIKFDEEKFKAAMDSDPELVSDIFTGSTDTGKGLTQIIEDTLTPYATRMTYKNGGSYGKLIDEAGSEKVSLSLTKNLIYSQLEEMQNTIDKLNSQLKTEQDRYISQFSQMEVLISQMNSQAGYLSSLTG